MKTTHKLFLAVSLLVVGVIYVNAELSKQPTLDQLLKSDTQIVYFDGLQIFGQSQEVLEAKNNLEAKFQEEGKKLQQLRAEVEKVAAELKSMQGVATEQAMRAKQEEGQLKQNAVEVKERSLQQYAQQELQQTELAMAQKLKDYASDVAQKEGYRLVLAGGIAYGDNKLNISEKIATAWNADFSAKKAKKDAPGQSAKTKTA